ncbi:MAG: hypothetical protein B6247_15420 [Candidatus Parabeggiatoa sp. nov. 2]|nr:MAG: hypothetical protein B6247_15420 [Beggiatoa sp. 4572_84]
MAGVQDLSWTSKFEGHKLFKKGNNMETIARTLHIPKNHTISFTLPNHIPVGQAEVVLVIHPSLKAPKISKDEALLKLAGTLKNSPRFSGDSVQLQRQMRQEWDG